MKMFDRLPDPDDLLIQRVARSENGRWEQRISRQLFGWRVQVGVAGDRQWDYTVVEYCAGNNPWWVGAVWGAVGNALKAMPEEITPRSLEDAFPRQAVKPMGNDPPCWLALNVLGGTPEQGAVAVFRTLNETLGGVSVPVPDEAAEVRAVLAAAGEYVRRKAGAEEEA